MKKSEFAALMASERCLPGIEDTAPLCTRQFEPGGCVECWTEFLDALEDDETQVCEWKRSGCSQFLPTCDSGRGWTSSFFPTYYPHCGRKVEVRDE